MFYSAYLVSILITVRAVTEVILILSSLCLGSCLFMLAVFYINSDEEMTTKNLFVTKKVILIFFISVFLYIFLPSKALLENFY